MIRGFRAGLGLNPEIRPSRTFIGRTDSIAPVVSICKATARIANDRGFDLAHFVDQIFANAANILDFRIFPHPNAVIDHATNVLDKVPVKIGRDRAQNLVRQNLDSSVGCARCDGARQPRGSGKQERRCTECAVADELPASDHDSTPGSGEMSGANGKARMSASGFVAKDKQLCKLLKCGKSIYSLGSANAPFNYASLPKPLSAKPAVSGGTSAKLQSALSLLHCICGAVRPNLGTFTPHSIMGVCFVCGHACRAVGE